MRGDCQTTVNGGANSAVTAELDSKWARVLTRSPDDHLQGEAMNRIDIFYHGSLITIQPPLNSFLGIFICGD